MLDFSIKNTGFIIIMILICSIRMITWKKNYDKIQWYTIQAILIIAIVMLGFQICDLITTVL